MKTTKIKPAKPAKARKPATITPAPVPQPSAVEIMAQVAADNAATRAASVIREAVELHGVPNNADSIGRAFTEGTPEYWNRHAALAEREGNGCQWYQCKRRADQAAACEVLAAKQIVRTPFVEDATVLLADAVSLLTPKQLDQFQKLRGERTGKVTTDGYLYRMMRPKRPAA
jgi:hypothetical protein